MINSSQYISEKISMEPITILPHHALSYFEFFYLRRDPIKHHQWYDSEVNQNEAVDRVRRVLTNLDQLVQLVSGYDDWCRFCPYHKDGENYDTEKEPCVRDGWNIPREVEFAKIVGLDSVLGKEPITSRQFFEMMRPTYERLIAEPLYTDKNSIEYTLRQLFRYYELPLEINGSRLPEEFGNLIKKAKELGLSDKIIKLL